MIKRNNSSHFHFAVALHAYIFLSSLLLVENVPLGVRISKQPISNGSFWTSGPGYFSVLNTTEKGPC